MIKRVLLAALLALPGLAWADWASDRDGSSHYVEITVLASAIDEATPFFIVYGSDFDSTFHGAMDAASDTTGRTILAANADGSTRLPCWPVDGDFDTGTDTWALAVRGTGMSASVDTVYRLYVGNAALSMPAVTDTYGRNAVFSGYSAVYFPGAGTGTVDMTGNGHVLSGSISNTASGYEGIAAGVFNGTSDALTRSAAIVSSWPITIEALGYSTSSSAAQTLVSQGNSGTGTGANIAALRFRGDVGDVVTFAVDGSSGSTATASTSTTYSINTWYYAMGVHDTDNDETKAYLNGGGVGTSGTVVAGPSFNQFAIGVFYTSSQTNWWAGRIAFVAVSPVVRSANYSSTMQDIWAGSAYTAGSTVSMGGGGPTIADRTRGFFVLTR